MSGTLLLVTLSIRSEPYGGPLPTSVPVYSDRSDYMSMSIMVSLVLTFRSLYGMSGYLLRLSHGPLVYFSMSFFVPVYSFSTASLTRFSLILCGSLCYMDYRSIVLFGTAVSTGTFKPVSHDSTDGPSSVTLMTDVSV